MRRTVLILSCLSIIFLGILAFGGTQFIKAGGYNSLRYRTHLVVPIHQVRHLFALTTESSPTAMRFRDFDAEADDPYRVPWGHIFVVTDICVYVATNGSPDAATFDLCHQQTTGILYFSSKSGDLNPDGCTIQFGKHFEGGVLIGPERNVCFSGWTKQGTDSLWRVDILGYEVPFRDLPPVE
ncbi:MAG: hypothetical protein COU08_03105 [Candidatus Harrisonbacteria bacterium CG10_big_fil_rev_8_21_14_0_10_42_17]|uniref:Uncharacterized protein n=1 Tax=Candidatus Harrisonbacteria bacterium CG10_big_fil_rev_8_21_14_0_10_42_17 TaxID=1974584 RepID=A0A2M6WHR7_9BACT|nr:MAG: hypothetical protein COU08_03105 [Candidatus Harrisonbacteria bacterium CG10_big_fil_rev_8_21_14_0_10_42_17]